MCYLSPSRPVGLLLLCFFFFFFRCLVFQILEHLQLHYALKRHWPHLVAIVFLSDCPLVDPLLPITTFDPSNVLHSGQGFLLPNVVAIRYFLVAIWPLVDTGWPLHDLRSQQFNMLWSGTLPTIGSHRVFLSNLTSDPGWPLHDLWP